MILMIIFTGAIVVIFRTKPLNNIKWKIRIPLALGGFIFTLFFCVSQMPNKRCGNMPVGGYQLIIAALSVACIILFINKKVVLFSCSTLILFAGMMLEGDFRYIARNSDGFVAIDSTTNRPMAKGCTNIDDTGETPSITPEVLWHTSFTGIYRIKSKETRSNHVHRHRPPEKLGGRVMAGHVGRKKDDFDNFKYI